MKTNTPETKSPNLKTETDLFNQFQQQKNSPFKRIKYQTRIPTKSIKYYGKIQEIAKKSIFTGDEETNDTELRTLSCLLKSSNNIHSFIFEFTGCQSFSEKGLMHLSNSLKTWNCLQNLNLCFNR